MTDEDILNRFLYNGVKCTKVTTKLLENLEEDDEAYIYMSSRYDDSSSLREILARIINGIEVHPVCPNCGKPINFTQSYAHPFNKHCSIQCQTSGDIKKTLSRETSFRKYGVDHPFKSEVVIKKIKKTFKEKYGTECLWKSEEIKKKARKTKEERYGDPNFLNHKKMVETSRRIYGKENYNNRNQAIANTDYKKISEKRAKTKLERYGDPFYKDKEKYKKTCLEKYGVDHARKSEVVKKKIKETNNLLYGADFWNQTPEGKIAISRIVSSKPTQQKIYNTKKRNNTFHTSKLEDKSCDMLRENFGEVIRQYRDERYPFACDFYVPSTDTFIECNYHWTHGGHAFDSSSAGDAKKLELWKSRGTAYYMNAIHTWTVSDVKKAEAARNAKIDFVAFYTIRDLERWLSSNAC